MISTSWRSPYPAMCWLCLVCRGGQWHSLFMTFKRGFAVYLAVGCCVLACSSSKSASGGLCPTCKPQLGGESSDFGGGQENCLEQAQPLSDAVRAELQVADVVASATSPFTTSLRWAVPDTVRGDTTLTATTTLDAATYRVIGVEASEGCRDRVLIPATVNVATADGGLKAILHGAVELRRGDLIWHLRAHADLASTNGNLPLELDETRAHRGQLSLALSGFPDTRRGSFNADLSYFPAGVSEVGTMGDSTQTPGLEQVRLELGRFPADDCSIIDFPLDLEIAHPWLGGMSAHTIHSRLRAALPAITNARWLDGSTTELSLALDDLVDQRVCLGAAFGDPILRFASVTRLRSADARVDSTLPSHESRLLGTSGEPQTWTASNTIDSLPGATPAAGVNLNAGSVAGHDSLRVLFELQYQWHDNTLAGGGIVDIADELSNQRLDCVAWPPGSEFQDQRCR